MSPNKGRLDENPTISDNSLTFLLFTLSSAQLLTILFVLSIIAVKIVKIFSWPDLPKIFLHDTSKNAMITVAQQCKQLQEPYVPPFLWGRNGHIQTAVYGILGHASLARQADRRHFIRLADGTTVTFDLFEPLAQHVAGDFTLAICPGIANSSQSNYIRTCVHHAQEAGFRCAVLNHLGALKDIKLTSSRIFTYGETEEYATMVHKIASLYNRSKIICIGFSMGANIMTKYLGEKYMTCPATVISGISVCQGYDAIRTISMLHNMENCRRLYMYVMAENVKRIMRNNYSTVIQPYVRDGQVEEKNIWAATSLYTIDEHYTRKVKGFNTTDAYYQWCSSLPHVPQIKVPMVFINALDDPLMPIDLIQPIIRFCEANSNSMLILTKHGGHLGFLEGSSLSPLSVTWLDRLIIHLSNSLINVYNEENNEKSTVES